MKLDAYVEKPASVKEQLEARVKEHPNHDFELRLKRNFALDEHGRVVPYLHLPWEENVRVKGGVIPLDGGVGIVTDEFRSGIVIDLKYINSIVRIGPKIYNR